MTTTTTTVTTSTTTTAYYGHSYELLLQFATTNYDYRPANLPTDLPTDLPTITYYYPLLSTTQYLHLTTYYVLLIIYYLLPTTYYLLLTTRLQILCLPDLTPFVLKLTCGTMNTGCSRKVSCLDPYVPAADGTEAMW